VKPALARGQMQLIGATTISEYRKYIEKDAALERRLQPVMVKEPSVPETVEILRAIAASYEKHHRVKYTPESLVTAAKLSERYLTDRFLPDKVCPFPADVSIIFLLSNLTLYIFSGN
jgi:ATP-dependent Clp protease ATP-binding subunit ClpC